MKSFNKNKNICEQYDLIRKIKDNIDSQEYQKERMKNTQEELKILKEKLHSLEKEFVEQYLKVNKGRKNVL
jgi:polyhydroxyalkanoate synthesis regulator phasin